MKIEYHNIGLFISTLLVALSVRAQKEIVTQENAWLVYIGNHRVTDQVGFHTEYQFRRAEIFQDWQQSLLRLGIDYYTKTGEQVTAGYAWIKSFPYGEQPIAHANNEHRIWQQIITKSKFSRIELQHRYRLEQRFIENWKKSIEGEYEMMGHVYRQRVRYRCQIMFPISRSEMSDNTLFFVANDEVFLGFGKGIGKNVLDQNRVFTALGWRFNSACNIQLGYLNQYIMKSDGIHAERNHTLQAIVTYNVDWRMKEE
jgi:hypothetical protein